jgi:hypothetical protein
MNDHVLGTSSALFSHSLFTFSRNGMVSTIPAADPSSGVQASAIIIYSSRRFCSLSSTPLLHTIMASSYSNLI